MTGMIYPPLPAPPLMLSHLLGAVFLLHVVFLDFVMASPLVTVWYLWIRRENGRANAKWLSAALPVGFTFTINFGVASLLFVQALFAERFYTANVILAKAWLSVIGLLLVAFYGAYVSYRLIRKPAGGAIRSGLIDLLVTALVWAIGAVMIANYFVTGSQEMWRQLLVQPLRVLDNLTVLPRALHFVTGAFAVTGFWMVWIAWWRSKRGAPPPQIAEFRHHGLLLAAGATGLQIIIGVWFLIWLPTAAWDQLFSGTFPGIVWIFGVACGLVMLGFLILASVFPDRILWQRISTILLFCTLGGMLAGRDVVRLASFGPEFQITQIPSATQPSVLLMFFGTLAGGVAVALWMYWLIRRSPPTSNSHE